MWGSSVKTLARDTSKRRPSTVSIRSPESGTKATSLLAVATAVLSPAGNAVTVKPR